MIIRFFEEILFQLLVEQLLKQIHYVIDWLNTFPWQLWFV